MKFNNLSDNDNEIIRKINELFTNHPIISHWPDGINSYCIRDIYHLDIELNYLQLYHEDWLVSKIDHVEYTSKKINSYEELLDECILFKELILPKYL